MKKRILWLLMSCLVVLSLALASCAPATPTVTPPPTTPPATTPPPTTTTPPTAVTPSKDVPQYGGTLTFRTDADPMTFDDYFRGGGSSGFINYLCIGSNINESLARRDMDVDVKVWDNRVKFTPAEYMKGWLAESWEQPDLTTLIVHIRKGVRWQDKPPMNGREFTAYDAEYHFDRMRGQGYNFTKPTPYIGLGTTFTNLASLTATDKYTLVYKAKAPTLELFFEALDPVHNMANIVPREVVEQYGDMSDWRRVVGTGPYILNDYVSSSSVTLVKNPNYWRFDDRYPQNRLPYADKLRFLVIGDMATTLAALRTGKIDLVEGISWEQAASLTKTNPELLQVSAPGRGAGLGMRVDLAPFTDIRVRQAIQKAIDLKTIAATKAGGTVSGNPTGTLGPSIKGYAMPYEEWAPEVKEAYAYDPAKAKQLLAEAGFPNGFKTTCVIAAVDDSELYQILKSYLAQIGVTMEIQVMDQNSYTAFVRGLKTTAMMSYQYSVPITPLNQMRKFTAKYAYNYCNINDTAYEDLYNKAAATLDIKSVCN